MADIVRVLRIIEYTGPRDRVEETIANSIQGTRDCGRGLIIRGATIGTYPEILEQGQSTTDAPENRAMLRDALLKGAGHGA